MFSARCEALVHAAATTITDLGTAERDRWAKGKDVMVHQGKRINGSV
jgi:hypothetical protein